MEDSPEQDRSITDQELEYLRATVGVTTKEVTWELATVELTLTFKPFRFT